jgi:glycosyltransferase involved in cell wall biosynthesis
MKAIVENTPLFTVFLPSYNGGAFLREAVGSVLAQTFCAWELIILDDGSTDGSVEWLQSLDEPRLRVLESAHIGIVENWRRSLQIDKAVWMTFLGQDDVFDANFLETVAGLIAQHPNADVFHAHFRFIDQNGKLLRSCRAMPERETASEYIAALFSDARDTYGTGYILRSKKYDAIDGISPWERLLFADDALWISVMRGSHKITSARECFACRLHHKSVSGSPPWRSWANAMENYILFLQQLGENDEAVHRVLDAHAPNYFLRWCRNVYNLALMQATKANRRVKPDAAQILVARLEQVQKGLGAQLRNSRSVRLRETINRVAVLRGLYRTYIRLRYGKQHLKTS